MEKSGSYSQQNRITRNTGAASASNTADSANIRQQMIADDVHYHAEKLGFGEHGAHEGWIQAEEAGMAEKSAVSAEARHKMIALAAYYLAEKRDFAGNGTLEDWIKAEAEIDTMLHDRSVNS